MIGRQRHYQPNPQAPIFQELRRILLKTIGAVDPLRDALDPLKGRIAFAALFGSMASGGDNASSDFDVLIVSDHPILEDVYAALDPVDKLLGRKINPVLINSVELESRKKGSFPSKVSGGPVMPLVGNGSCGAARDQAAR